MTVVAVTKMLEEGRTVEEIAKEYGYKSTIAVNNFMKKNKIEVKGKASEGKKERKLTEDDIPQIKALYTNGPWNLTMTAEELKVSKKQLKEFVEKNHIVKPVR